MPLTPTTRLALTQIDPNPTTGDFVDPTVINANNTKVDGAIGAPAATSGARPSTPFDGQLIRETDTRRVWVRNNTQGVWDPITGMFFGTSGARPASPTDGMLYRETDTRRNMVYNGTSGAWENISGAFICTSGSRPGIVYDGMIIRETDTRRVYIWNNTNSAWDLLYNGLGAPPAGVLAAYRTSNSSGKQNNTMADDTQLTVPVVAGATYLMDAYIPYLSPTAAQFQMGFSGPSGATLNWSSWAEGTAATTSEGVVKVEQRTIAQTALVGGSGATLVSAQPKGLLSVSATPGSFTFRWAQVNTTASDTIVHAGAWIRLMRIA